ncbi:MAG: polyphosphate polymerase domain-containing protein [Verrucomicrobia bacterium]|nr:polyphosphate polymerase domain-containing protein [Verrucomicrobiota bacterium]
MSEVVDRKVAATDRPIRHFNRYEMKYVVHRSAAGNFQERLGEYVEKDPNAGDRPGYRISSLYYDSPSLSAFWEKVEGLKFRRKVRVRRYDDDPRDLWHVEIKQRIDKTVQKRRTCVNYSNAVQLMSEGTWDEQEYGNDPVLSEVVYLAKVRSLQPAVVVGYHREPFVGRYDDSLRITFDTSLYGWRGRLDDWGSSACGRLILPLDLCVVEVKFDNFVPLWLCKLLAEIEYVSERMSKYCEAASVFWNEAGINGMSKPELTNWQRG